MAIKAGAFLHSVNGVLIDRIQTGGPGNLNIPLERIRELGNWQTVADVRDTADLSFDLESFDMSCEFEAIVTGADSTAVVDGQAFTFDNSMPIDVISPFKSDTNAYDIVRGIAVPYLTLEKVTYKFGIKQNATQHFTLRGDAIYYIPGSPYYQEYVNTGATTYSFANTAFEYVESGASHYALCITLLNRTTKASKRLFQGTDFTNTASGFTLLAALQVTYPVIAVTYGSATAATYAQALHASESLSPAAIRGKDIDVYVASVAASQVFTRWGDVQSVDVNRSVTLVPDEEMGNPHYISQDYDTADVNGTVVIKGRNPAALWDKIAQVADVATNKVVGPYTSVTIPLEIRISDPDNGVVIKTIFIPDARFTPPAMQGRVQTKLETTFNWVSDTGSLIVYRGNKP